MVRQNITKLVRQLEARFNAHAKELYWVPMVTMSVDHQKQRCPPTLPFVLNEHGRTVWPAVNVVTVPHGFTLMMHKLCFDERTGTTETRTAGVCCVLRTLGEFPGAATASITFDREFGNLQVVEAGMCACSCVLRCVSACFRRVLRRAS